MDTKKLSTFEYAGKVHPGVHGLEGLHRHEAFESPFGHVMVVVASKGMDETQEDLAGTVVERIQYYLEHADDDRIENLAANALIYSSGFLYQWSKKDASKKASEISCLCIVNHKEKIYYSWAGDQVCMSLWDGKKLCSLLSYPDDDKPSQSNQEIRETEEQFIGQQADLKPQIASEPLVPLSGDKLLLGSGSVCRYMTYKEVRKVMQDSMPLQTKLLRIIGVCGKEASQDVASLMMVSFYHLRNMKRTFAAGKEKKTKSGDNRSRKDKTGSAPRKGRQQPLNVTNALKYLLIILVGVFVGYMVYDLFIYDPRPAVRLPAPTPAEEHDTIVSAPDDVMDEALDEHPPMPEDLVYTVRGGDTWSRIYRQYQVCSWFIINHPRNTGRFGRDGGLIAGQQLRIPVRYSADPELNPYYYQEFTTSQTGQGCENVDQEFLDEFLQKHDTQ